MKFIVALNIQTRFSRPSIGDFVYSDKHQRHVWKGKEITSIEELSKEVNEALDFALIMDQIDMTVRVYPIEEVKEKALEAEFDAPSTEAPKEKPSFSQLFSEEPEVSNQEEALPETGNQPERRGPGRPRKHPLTPVLTS